VPLERLAFQGLRNLRPLDIQPGLRINLIAGDNGSGKTSVLEGIHILGMGRSFRTRHLRHVITHDAPAFQLHGRVAGEPAVSLGLERRRDAAEMQIRLAGERIYRISRLVETLPLQLINPDSFQLLEGSPARRRQFLDWGVFHVKHEFFDVWQRVRRALKHRNALLRHGRMDGASLSPWELELAHWGERLNVLREAWVEDFMPVFELALQGLMPLQGLELRYYRGWDKRRSLAEALYQGRDTDRQMGFTQQGPQRADLGIRLHRRPAVEILSRGQQKLVVSALKLAQGTLFETMTGRTCIYLIDDLPAELDSAHQSTFCDWLERMHCQVFITSVDPNALTNNWRATTPVSRFHVKQSSHGEGLLAPLDRQIS
jgi:DNA replication and repair protein RecF